MRKLLRLLAATAAFGLVLAVSTLWGGSLTLFTGPSGTNPISNPNIIGDVNTVINGVNNNAAFAGNGQPLAVIGAVQTSSTKLGSIQQGTTTMIQIVNSWAWTSTTGTGSCNVTNATVCLGIIDNTGVLRWIPAT